MIYFYKNKKTGEEFAIDNEKTASHLHRDKKFDEKYEFLGRSSGEKFKELIKQAPKLEGTPEEKFNGAVDNSARQEAWNVAFQAELEIAKQDRTLPADFTKMGLDGSPLQNKVIVDSMNMMG